MLRGLILLKEGKDIGHKIYCWPHTNDAIHVTEMKFLKTELEKLKDLLSTALDEEENSPKRYLCQSFIKITFYSFSNSDY